VVADVDTDLQAIVAVVLSFRSRPLKAVVIEVLAADLDEAAVVVL
jgi:hypothetical protein